MVASDLDPLIRDFVAWVADGKPYRDVIETWRTSCPRLTVWEDASERGFVERTWRADGGTMIAATAAGRAFLVAKQQGRGPELPCDALAPQGPG